MAGWMDALQTVGDVLDTPGGVVRDLVKLKNPLPGIFNPRQRTTGREVLGLSENQEGLDAGDVGGFLAEMALDPTNLIGGGLLGHNALQGATN